jgi:maleamate amidohydrolase
MVYQRQGFGASLGFKGRIGLVLVDFVNGFADPEVFGGGNIKSAISSTVAVLAEAGARAWPVAQAASL